MFQNALISVSLNEKLGLFNSLGTYDHGQIAALTNASGP